MPSDGPYRRKNWLIKLSLLPQKPFIEQLFRWIPEEYLHVRDAVDCLGQNEIGDWNGSEKNARWLTHPPDKPWLWHNSKKVERYFSISENNEIIECSELEAEAWWLTIEPNLIAEWGAEKMQ